MGDNRTVDVEIRQQKQMGKEGTDKCSAVPCGQRMQMETVAARFSTIYNSSEFLSQGGSFWIVGKDTSGSGTKDQRKRRSKTGAKLFIDRFTKC